MIKLTDFVTGDPVWINTTQIAEFYGSGLRGTQSTELRMIGSPDYRTFDINPYDLAAVLD